jgi:hypothetical protein
MLHEQQQTISMPSNGAVICPNDFKLLDHTKFLKVAITWKTEAWCIFSGILLSLKSTIRI